MMHWNAGGWFGAQLGGSLWILIAGVLALRLDTQAGISAIVLFGAANGLGSFLWTRRDGLSAYAGIQLLLALVGTAGLAAVYVLERAGIFEAIQVGARVSAQSMYVVLIVVITALMLLFYLRFGRK